MKVNRKIINQSISILMLLVYLFGSSSIFSFHNHSDDNDHHHHYEHDLSFCENTYQNSFQDSDCSHESHLISSIENCDICDHFSNCKPAILDNTVKSNVELFSVTKVQLFTSFYVHDSTNTLNKSPPFII
jgi:hypothetical protein